MLNEIKIIAGLFKGKKIKLPQLDDLRPTPNRLRESLFNVLQFDIQASECLDAFAGSGALGFEAFSRGANHITFVENNPIAAKYLAKTMHDFASDRLTLIEQDCLSYLHSCQKTFDIIFLDPPFKQDQWQNCCELIVTRKLLNAHGIIYLESPRAIQHIGAGFQTQKHGKVGEVCYSIFRKE